jgi:protein-tyrosine kinase
MNRVHEAWRKVEPEGLTQKGNRSDPDGAPTMPNTDPIIFALATDADSTHPVNDGGAALDQCRSSDWRPDPRTMLFLGSEAPAQGKENFWALRARLCQMRERTPLKTIAVVSSVPKEGRSFVAANLAHAMARQQGCRVLLIDADLRNPSLHSALGVCQAPGLSEYLLEEAAELSAIQRGQIENLFFLAAGRPVSGPSGIISNGRLKPMLDRLSPLFEWIVIDSPAALPVSDAELISGFCDGVVMVVRSNSTPFDLVRKARYRFREEQILGVVLNGIAVERQLENHYNDGSSDKPKPNGKWR